MLIVDDRAQRDMPLDVLEAVYRFAAPALTAGQLPEFGSEAWAELPEDDPARWAAVVRAAMSWLTAMVFGNDIPAEVIHAEIGQRMAAASHAISVAAHWREIAAEPTYAELARRRKTREVAA